MAAHQLVVGVAAWLLERGLGSGDLSQLSGHQRSVSTSRTADWIGSAWALIWASAAVLSILAVRTITADWSSCWSATGSEPYGGPRTNVVGPPGDLISVETKRRIRASLGRWVRTTS
jgi:hypothetical protein